MSTTKKSEGFSAEEKVGDEGTRQGAEGRRRRGKRDHRRARGHGTGGSRARQADPRLVKKSAPGLTPKTWYGMPAYAKRTARSSASSATPVNSRSGIRRWLQRQRKRRRWLDVAGLLCAEGADRRRREEDRHAREESGELIGERNRRLDAERARDPRRARLRCPARPRLLGLDGSRADPRMVGRRHGRRGDGRPPGWTIPTGGRPSPRRPCRRPTIRGSAPGRSRPRRRGRAGHRRCARRGSRARSGSRRWFRSPISHRLLHERADLFSSAAVSFVSA